MKKKVEYTGKFNIGDLVKVVDGGQWENPNGTIVQLRPEKDSHNYQVKLSEETWNNFWFSEWELEEIKGEFV